MLAIDHVQSTTEEFHKREKAWWRLWHACTHYEILLLPNTLWSLSNVKLLHRGFFFCQYIILPSNAHFHCWWWYFIGEKNCSDIWGVANNSHQSHCYACDVSFHQRLIWFYFFTAYAQKWNKVETVFFCDKRRECSFGTFVFYTHKTKALKECLKLSGAQEGSLYFYFSFFLGGGKWLALKELLF